MNSTKLHSLVGLRQEKWFWELWLQRWRAGKLIKEGGKPGEELLQGGRGRRREQRRTHADSSEFERAGKTSEDSGARRQRKREKRIGGRRLGRETATGDGPKDSDFGLA